LKSPHHDLAAAVVRRKLENALQAALVTLGAGRGDDRIRRRARDLAIALEWIEDDDDAGICALCGAPIDATRFAAMPGTRVCAVCAGGTSEAA
jgi:RNA polymerase-binding transcription factor DksA